MLHGRSPNALIGSWVGGLLLCGATYWFSHMAPAFEDLVTPVYWIAGVILIAFTVKWIRSRATSDRRGDDRRRTSRREREDLSKPDEH